MIHGPWIMGSMTSGHWPRLYWKLDNWPILWVKSWLIPLKPFRKHPGTLPLITSYELWGWRTARNQFVIISKWSQTRHQIGIILVDLFIQRWNLETVHFNLVGVTNGMRSEMPSHEDVLIEKVINYGLGILVTPTALQWLQQWHCSD